MQTYADANPPDISKEVKSSYMKFIIDDNKNGTSKQENEHQRIRLEVGVDKSNDKQEKNLIKTRI